MIGVALGILAVILVGPGSIWVGRWEFLHRAPRPAVALWQAGSVSALLSVVGAGLALSLGLFHDREASVAEIIVYSMILIFTLIVVGRLIWSLVIVARTTGARRSRHRQAVDLLDQVGRRSGLPGPPGLRVMSEPMPVAYCLPAVRHSRVVLSDGALRTLSSDEVAAVLAHEEAHVRARHDLVLDTFTALHRAFPIAVRSDVPLKEARLLVELLADDAARRRTGAIPLARALVAMAAAPVPRFAMGVSYATVVRVSRLADDVRPHRMLSAGIYLLAAGLIALPVVILGAQQILDWLGIAFNLGWY
ncbi:MAG: M56 family metallopeptidase [Microlunatus sp.]|nr:M56 family metallopeptidase [Microlunatus sp.]